jgi:hypothetical protein
MHTIKMSGGTLTLPPETIKDVSPDDEFTITTTGDTIILKKVKPLRLSELATRAPKSKPMSLKEISDEVHRYRRSKHARRR